LFGNAQSFACGRDVEQNLEPDGRQSRSHRIKHIAAHHEKPAHRVRQFGRHQHAAEPHGDAAHAGAPCIPIADVPARRVAAADHDVGIALFEQVEHLGQQPFVMLQIRVDHRKVRGRGREHPLDARRRQTAASDPRQASDAAVRRRMPAHGLSGAVGRVVIDEQHLPATLPKTQNQASDQLGDIVLFVECRHDYRQFRTAAHLVRDGDRAAEIRFERSMVFGSVHLFVSPRRRPDSPSIA